MLMGFLKVLCTQHMHEGPPINELAFFFSPLGAIPMGRIVLVDSRWDSCLSSCYQPRHSLDSCRQTLARTLHVGNL